MSTTCNTGADCCLIEFSFNLQFYKVASLLKMLYSAVCTIWGLYLFSHRNFKCCMELGKYDKWRADKGSICGIICGSVTRKSDRICSSFLFCMEYILSKDWNDGITLPLNSVFEGLGNIFLYTLGCYLRIVFASYCLELRLTINKWATN